MTEDVVRALGLLCLGTRLRRVGERLQADTDAIIAARGLEISASQFPYLASLDRLGPLTLGELATSVGVSQPGATRSVNALIRQGYVTAEPAADDQRRKIIALSAKGRRTVDIGKSDLWPRVTAAVSDLCTDLDGALLAQLDAIEARLDATPLAKRAVPFGKDGA